MKTNYKQLSFSLGYNFDYSLLNGIIALNETSPNKIIEFYAALPDSPISSARPTSRIPRISWEDFKKQIEIMTAANIKFNFLMNTFSEIDKETELKLKIYLKKLQDIGVNKITVGNPGMCYIFKNIDDRFEVTISSIFGAKTKNHIQKAVKKWADEIYLDGLYVNRNFQLLKELLGFSSIKIRLYANISCLSQCPLKNEHYSVFFGKQTIETIKKNDDFFSWCSKIKINNPVKWLQMPWIRPEDVRFYNTLGVDSFKLSDRLAPTKTLLFIAYHYLKEQSPKNLFNLIERDGAKYKNLINFKHDQIPIFVDSKKIPRDFLNHFIKGECISIDSNCSYCNILSREIIKVYGNNEKDEKKEYEITVNYSY